MLRQRKFWVLIVASAVLVTPISTAFAAPSQESRPSSPRQPETPDFAQAGAGAVFAPGTSPDYAKQVLEGLDAGRPPAAQFSSHWNPSRTALNRGGAAQGDSVELTWSIIPDGTPMPAQGSPDTTCNSNLIATFNQRYGAGNWQAEIQRVWDDWTALTGNVYTMAVTPDGNDTPIDDGAAWPTSPGLVNVRGDIRVGGCTIDGNPSGGSVLAYNFFPNDSQMRDGDMKIESTDNFYASNPLSPHFHNVFSHEHGHGAGLDHVCPTNGTKLMEPLITTSFLGLQHDDIRGIQRGYGDRFELIGNPNDSAGTATPLLPLGGAVENQLSLDGNGDEDWFTFPAAAGDFLDVVVQPSGEVYLEGNDPAVDLCSSASPTLLDSRIILDLGFEIRTPTGVLIAVDAGGPGTTEEIRQFLPVSGTYFVRVTGSGQDDVQLYDLLVSRISGGGCANNDDFDCARPIDGPPATQTGDNTLFTTETGEPDQTCGAFVGAQSTAWWTWTSPGNGSVTIDTIGSNFDTVLAVYTGPAVDNLAQVACNYNAFVNHASVSFAATTGTTYMIQVDGFAFETGEIVLNVGGGPLCNGTDNDAFGCAFTIGGPPDTRTGNNVGYTVEAGEPEPEPACGTPANATAWWNWTSPSSGPVTINTAGSGFDTRLTVYTGNSVDALTQVACNDQFGGTDQSSVTFTSVAGTTYRVQVDGWNVSTGSITLNTSTPPPAFCQGVPVTVNLNFGETPTLGDDVILGTPGADLIVAEDGDDLICGEGGDDQIAGNEGNDTIFGGGGNDTIYGSAGSDILVGDAGTDSIQGNAGDDIIDGGTQNDVLSGNDGIDLLLGGTGNDLLFGGAGADDLNGESGADTILGGLDNDIINGGDDNDLISGNSGDDTIFGAAGDDTLYGVDGNDELDGEAGLDAILGGVGNDTITGGDDDDQLSGNQDDDNISGGAGNDNLYGVDGNDTMNGNAGNDTVLGGNGNDIINGGKDDDLLSGNAGNDTVSGDDGNDSVYGVDGLDALNGGNGNDILLGGIGADTMDGGPGDDSLSGENGNDTMTGGPGQDSLFGQGGDDTITTTDGEVDGVNGGPHNTGGDSCTGDPIDNIFNCNP